MKKKTLKQQIEDLHKNIQEMQCKGNETANSLYLKETIELFELLNSCLEYQYKTCTKI